LWAFQLDQVVNANPITCEAKNGKPYVAAIATDAVVAFTLL